MTYKQKALKAIWKLIVERYEGDKFIFCPLCETYFTCRGCPSHNLQSAKRYIPRVWCSRFKTYKIFYCGGIRSLRAKFWREAMPVLEKIPAKYYTPSGWCFKVFAFLDEIDARIMEEYNNDQNRNA